MTVEHFQAPDAPGFKLDPRVVGAFGRFAGGFWRGPSAVRAWALTLGLALFLILSTAATVALAVAGGADVVRVHDVESIARTVRMTDAIVRFRPR